MTTSCFEAALDFDPAAQKQLSIVCRFESREVAASLTLYGKSGLEGGPPFFALIRPSRPVSVKWQDSFEVRPCEGREPLGWGRVLVPVAMKWGAKKELKRVSFLEQMMGGNKDMLLALVQHGGAAGLREAEMQAFSRLTADQLRSLSQELEMEGRLLILKHSPLFLMSRPHLDFIGEKILACLARHHAAHPDEPGLALEKIRKRFSLHPLAMRAVLEKLSRQRKVRVSGDQAALADHEVLLTPKEEKLLEELERFYKEGGFRSTSSAEIQTRYRLSAAKLDRLLAVLVERNKVVQSKDGFYLHSRWLDEVIVKLRQSGKTELTVADFKRMTGLSRKYAIPLLELLDQMGVTRRRQAVREVLASSFSGQHKG